VAGPVTGPPPAGVDPTGVDANAPTGPTGPAGPAGLGDQETGAPGQTTGISAQQAEDAAAANATTGDGATSGGEDSVICTELHRQGFMDDETWGKDQAFGRTVPADVRSGYLLWALPVVRGMRRAPAFTRLVWLLAKPWAREMAYGDSVTGRIIMAIGWAVCARLGRLEAYGRV
jgi:hypothetical protein